MRQPRGVVKKMQKTHFFWLTGSFSTLSTRTPWVMIFKRGHFEGDRHAFWIFQFCKNSWCASAMACITDESNRLQHWQQISTIHGLTWTPYFLVVCCYAVVFVCICVFGFFFGAGCLGHDFLEGLRPRSISGRHSVDGPFHWCKVDRRFLLKTWRCLRGQGNPNGYQKNFYITKKGGTANQNKKWQNR